MSGLADRRPDHDPDAAQTLRTRVELGNLVNHGLCHGPAVRRARMLHCRAFFVGRQRQHENATAKTVRRLKYRGERTDPEIGTHRDRVYIHWTRWVQISVRV